ncbi:hypothetical protein [Bacillus licheniformis]|uniref:hypothetical protein n=1 Tax=Bacillus licheniformis TaxID=1402 RepID=UPI003999CE36
MSENKPSIFDRYSHEILDIENKLNDLKNNRIYEITGAKMDGYLATNAEQLREKIHKLLLQIDRDAPSFYEKLSEALDNKK